MVNLKLLNTGRSNALNIAERLRSPRTIVDNARELCGELNQIIVGMERFKQEFHQNTREALKYLTLSRELHKKLLVARQNVAEHAFALRYRKLKVISENAAQARSLLHSGVCEVRTSSTQPANRIQTSADRPDEKEMMDNTRNSISDNGSSLATSSKQSQSEEHELVMLSMFYPFVSKQL